MKYSPSAFGVGQLSGSSGGTTASRNRFGSYFRARTIPVNPRTPIQTLRRETLAGLAAYWRTLSNAERNTWDALALQISKSDSLGNTYNPTGLQAFVGNNSLRIFAGAAVVDTAPVLDAPPVLTSATGDYENTLPGVFTSLDVLFAPTPLAAGQRIAVYSTGILSPGRSFVKPSEYRLLAVSAAAQASPYTLSTEYQAIYGTVMNTGSKIALKVVPISANYFRGAAVESLNLSHA